MQPDVPEPFSDADAAFMRQAIALSTHSPLPDPNPRVGCVLVKDGQVVGEGFHHGSGTPHAEIEALHAAGDQAAGATAYVTLEPCNHWGRTGPCSQALIQAHVARVIYAVPDPNPQATGGASALRAAGIPADGGLLAGDAAQVNTVWLAAMKLGRPFVTWKVAATLDGHTAAADGTSFWITGEAARADVHRLRALCDAIIVGTGTVLADNPRLTVRASGFSGLQPARVVMGTRPIPPDSAVLPAWVTPDSPAHVLAELFSRGSRHVLLEGGATLAAAFWRAHLIDQVICYVAPALLGAGHPLIGDLGIHTMSEADRLHLNQVDLVDQDVRLTLTPDFHEHLPAVSNEAQDADLGAGSLNSAGSAQTTTV